MTNLRETFGRWECFQNAGHALIDHARVNNARRPSWPPENKLAVVGEPEITGVQTR